MAKLNIEYDQVETKGLRETMEYLGLSASDIVDEEFAKLDFKQLHVKLPYKSPPFRTNLYSVTLIIDGYGHYLSDGVSFDIEPNSLLFNGPGGLRQIEWHRITEIYHYTFSEQFLLRYAGVHIYQLFPFLLFETTEPPNTNMALYEDLASICKKMDTLYGSDTIFKKHILANLLVRFLLKIKEAFWSTYQSRVENGRHKNVLKDFMMHLEEHFEDKRIGKTTAQLRVKDYARQQKLHENYFSQIIKEKTGKTPKQWMDEKTCAVAINLIRHSSLSIKQISYRLGFLHTSHFTSFIKKTTGNQPAFYRMKITDHEN